MGSSLILQGGAAVAKTLKESVTQTGHGFTVGDVIRWDGTQVPPKYVKAIADTAQNAEVAGVVSSTPDSNEFEVTYHGYIDLPLLAGISAPVMFLSGSAGGSLAASPPSAVGTVVKPVLTKNSNGSGYLVMNYLGTQIGGSSTIAVDEIQPVGTIMPFAGSVIPDTWLACDGGSYAMGAYPELYSKLCYDTGDRVPMYGHIVEIAPTTTQLVLTEWTDSAVGDYIYIKNRTASAGAGTPVATNESSYDLVGVIIAKGTVTHSGAQGWTVRILGKYNSTTKRFEMPNARVLGIEGSGFVSRVRVYSSVASGSRGDGANINTASIVAFNTPDLRGKFALGVNDISFGEQETDTSFISSSGTYSMGNFGGEESHALTSGEMPAHTHTASTDSTGAHTHTATTNTAGDHRHKLFSASTLAQDAAQQVLPDGFAAVRNQETGAYLNYDIKNVTTNASLGQSSQDGAHTHTLTTASGGAHTHTITVNNTGSNTPHNNMPPYLAVRYIIKAKPYTRAAIIDGIDLPYNSLLVRDLRSRNVGGSNGDLVFHTNTSGDSGNGTEQMRLTTGGRLAVSNTNPLARLSVGSGSYSAINDYCADFISDNTEAGFGGVLFSQNSTNGFKLWTTGTGNSTPSNNRLNLDLIVKSTGLTLDSRTEPIMSIRGNGWVGIGTSIPQSTLDVNGTLKVGDFGGSTNVMAKPIGAVSGTNVGKVVPLIHFGGRAPTSLLSAGTWFVHFTGQMNGPSVPDENTVLSAAFTVTVPSGQFFGLAVNHNSNAPVRVAAQDGKSGVMGRFFTDTTAQTVAAGVDNTNHTVPAGWTEFTETGTAPFISRRYSTAGTDSPGADLTHSMVHHMADGSSAWAVMIHGFAIRIA